MSTKPSDAGRFAVSTLDADAVNISAPSSGLRDTGFPTNAIPTSANVNYLENLAYRWRKYLSDGAFSGASTFDSTVGITGVLTAGSTVGINDDTAIGTTLTLTPIVFTATNATEVFTATAHGLHTGDGPVRVSNLGGALPSGLTAGTDYWVIKLTANTFKLATTLSNAFAGTNLLIADDGTGTQTLSSTGSTVRGGSLTVAGNATVANNLTVAGSYGTVNASSVITTSVAGNTVTATNFKHGTFKKAISAWAFQPPATSTRVLNANDNWSSWAASPNNVITTPLGLMSGDRLLTVEWRCFKSGDSNPMTLEVVLQSLDPFNVGESVIDTFSDTSASGTANSVTIRTINQSIVDGGWGLRVTSTTSLHMFIIAYVTFDRP